MISHLLCENSGLCEKGRLQLGQEQFGEAERTLNQAVNLSTASFGTQHPATVRAIQALASLHQTLGSHKQGTGPFPQV